MLLAYLDETYSREAFVIACVLIDASAVPNLVRELDGIVDAVCSGQEPGSPRELHAYELAAGKGCWRSHESDLRLRAKVYFDALRSIERHVETVFVHRAVPGPSKGERTAVDRHVEGLSAVLAALDWRARVAGELAFVIADEVPYGDELRDVFSSSAHPALIDTLHFASSKASRLVQAADLVAYLARRRIRVRPRPSRGDRVDAWLWGAIEGKVFMVSGDEGAS